MWPQNKQNKYCIWLFIVVLFITAELEAIYRTSDEQTHCDHPDNGVIFASKWKQ